MAQQVRIAKSSSVEAVFRGLRRDAPVDASEIVRRLFKLHSGYADGLAASAKLEDTGSKRLPEDWLSEIETLYDVSRMQAPNREQRFLKSEQPARARSDAPKLNSRLAILGLSLLEEALYQQLKSPGIFDSLASEIEYALEDILTHRGQELYEKAVTSALPAAPAM